MSNSNLNFGQRIMLEAVWFCCRVVAILPHWFRYYILADIVYFLTYRCFRYRVKVVRQNLKNSFPELSDKERAKICRKFYHYLSEVGISTISLAGGDPSKTVLRNVEQQQIYKLKEITAGQSWVALTAHYGLWEYLGFWGDCANQALIAVYHPLRNKVFGELFERLRIFKNVEVVAIKDTIRYCLEHQDGINGMNYILGLIADQNPPRRPNSKWFTFLNQETIFFDGGEKIALKLKLPVYFIYQKRVGRGRYEFGYEFIHD
ncbi:MAG: lysophospholipid acyltransferase family protein, partial [Rikenellaceae bacterium]